MTWQEIELRLATLLKQALPLVLGLIIGALLVKVSGSTKLTTMFLMAISLASVVAIMFVLNVDLTRWLIFAIFFAMPIPFGVSLFYKEPEPFVVQANGLDIYLLDVFVFGLLLLRWLQQINEPQSVRPFFWCKPLLIPSLLLLLINFLSAIFTPYQFFAFSVVAGQIKVILVLLIVTNVLLQDQKLIHTAIWGMIWTLAAQGLIGIEQKVLGVIFTAENLGREISLTMQIGQKMVFRVAGTLDHPNDFAMFLNLIIPTAVYFLWAERNWSSKILIGGAVGVGVIAEIFSGSRGGWVALVAAMGVTLPFWLRRRGHNPIAGMGVAGLIGALGFGVLFAASGSLRDRLLLDDHGTAEVRYPLMEVAKNMIAANPFTGVGVNHYTYFMTQYDRTMDAIAFNYAYPVHNTFLLIAGETGIPSLLLVLSIFAVTIITAIKNFIHEDGIISVVSLGIVASLLTLIIHNLANPMHFFTDHKPWLLMGLVMAMYRMAQFERNESSASELSVNEEEARA